MVDYVIVEPSFQDQPSRCFKFPFQTCQVFCTELDHIEAILFDDPAYRVLSKLLSFIGNQPKTAVLNSTLGGYFNKIFSFWLLKRPAKMLEFLLGQKAQISSFFNHLYLSHCVTDLLVRICTVKNIDNVPIPKYLDLRLEILQHCVNSLEHYVDDDFISEQIFDILCGIVKKCYQMHDPKHFFDNIMSPFIFYPILEFSLSGGQSTKQGADFLKLLFYNMFVAEP